MHNCFHAGDILLPRHISMRKWACVACDQFSSQPEYWDQVAELVGDAPSTFHMIVPEAYLDRGDTDRRVRESHAAMERYLAEDLFQTFRRSFVYLERTMPDGTCRRGLVGQVDLEAYDFTPEAGAPIRATEATVRERIPPRVKLLEGAALEFPHVLLLCDDREDAILTAARQVRGEQVYDFELMQDGGRVAGWIVSGLGVGVVNAAVTGYIAAVSQGQDGSPMVFAVGDGNHSLAAAKAAWEAVKPALSGEELLTHPARYALVELENIHDPAIVFEPIHRFLWDIDPEALLEALRAVSVPEGHPVTVLLGDREERLCLDRSALALATLQPLLDRFLAQAGRGSMDYIHGADTLRQMAARTPDSLGLLLPGMGKDELFPGVLQGGVLPRKTFSMGEAREKRYYLEGKRRTPLGGETVLRGLARAKLNLTLDVLDRRADGYHDLRMVMQQVALGDGLILRLGTGRPWAIQGAGDMPLDESNLAWRAAHRFFDETGIDCGGLTIALNKKVPACAGLGGGSGDAAETLRLLNDHYGRPLDRERLYKLAEELGADVPFALFGGTALAEGKGERLSRLPDLPPCDIVLCKPDFPISTPALYQAIDREAIEDRPDAPAMCQALAAGDLAGVAGQLKNVFQPVVSREHPELEAIRAVLLDCGALGAAMSGSGPTMFGIFRDRAGAEAARARLEADYRDTFLTDPAPAVGE